MQAFLERNKTVAISVVAIAILISGYMIYKQIRTMTGSAAAGDIFFSDDDGQTWFSQPSGTISATRGGKEAVRAHVFSCGGKQFVGYLEKYSPAAKVALEQAAEAAKKGEQVDRSKVQLAIMNNGLLMKAPGDPAWVSAMGPASEKIRNVKCPDDSAAMPVR